jgi:hypothetical protein
LNEHFDLAGAVSYPTLNAPTVRHAIDKRTKSNALDATAQYSIFARCARSLRFPRRDIIVDYVLQRKAAYGPSVSVLGIRIDCLARHPDAARPPDTAGPFIRYHTRPDGRSRRCKSVVAIGSTADKLRRRA